MTEPGMPAYAALCADLAGVLPVRDGLADILGVTAADLPPPAQETAAPGAQQHAELVVDIATLRRLPAAIDDILGAEHEYTGLVADLAATIDTRPALSAILTRTAESRAAPTPDAVVDGLAAIYRAAPSHRLFLRLGDRHRHLHNARGHLDELRENLSRNRPGRDVGEHLRTVPERLARQRVVVTKAIMLLAGTVPGLGPADHHPQDQASARSGGGASTGPLTATVLFVDLVDFSALVEGLDVGEVRDLQTAYFSVVSDVVCRYGGVVEQYVGDAVMAVFGVPVDRGDSATRAVCAGLDLQQALADRVLAGRWRVQSRVGIATGEVIVDAATVEGGHEMVSGSVVSTAARVQAYTVPGTVAVSAATREATAGAIRYGDEPMPVNGPVPMWRVLGVAIRPPLDEGPAEDNRHEEAAQHQALAQLGFMLSQVDEELSMMAAEVTAVPDLAPEFRQQCLAAADTVAQPMEQLWQALSDFRGSDLRSADLDASDVEGLDGVWWSDGTADGTATRWPDDARQQIVEHSRRVPGLGRGIFVIRSGSAIGAER